MTLNRRIGAGAALVICLAVAAAAGEPRPGKEPGKEAPKDTTAEYLMELARVHLRFNRPDEAMPLLEKAAKAETDPAKKTECLRTLGEAQLGAGKAAEAAATFEQAVAACPDEEAKARLHLWLGGAHRTAGNQQKAEAAFWHVYKNSKDRQARWDGHRQFMELLKRKERLESAVDEYEKRVEANPKDEDALAVLVDLYGAAKRDPEKALAAHEKLAALKPDDLRILESLSFMCQQAKQYDKALDVTKRIYAKKPADQQLAFAERVVHAYRQAGKGDEAAAWVEKEIEAHKADADLDRHAANLYAQIGSVEKARAYLEKVVAASEGDRKTEAQMRLADTLRAGKQYADAEKMLRGILKDATGAPVEQDEKKKAAREKLKAAAKRMLIQVYEEQNKIHELDF